VAQQVAQVVLSSVVLGWRSGWVVKRAVTGSCALALAWAAVGCTGSNPAFVPPSSDAAQDAAVGPAPDAGTPQPQPPADTAGPEASSPTPDASASVDVAPPPAEAAPPAPEAAPPAGPDATAADVPARDTALDFSPDLNPAPILCPADPDLVLCLGFENEVKDESTHNLKPQASGLTFTTNPRAQAGDGKAGSFVAATRVQIPYNAAMDVTTLTIEATIVPRRLPTGSARMGILDYSREYSLFLYPNGKISCIVVLGGGVDQLDSATGLVGVDLASHVACTVTDKTIALWKNGLMVSSATIKTRLETGSGANTMVVGGNYSSSDPDPFDGLIDNLRVWRTARTGTGCAGGFTCN
jgi:hypothetical protein